MSSAECSRSTADTQLEQYRVFDPTQILVGKNSKPVFQPHLCCGRHLIRHRLASLPLNHNQRFSGVHAIDLACERHDNDSLENCVSGIITDDNGGPGLANFAGDGGAEGYPPHLTPARMHRLSALRSTLPPHARDHDPAPSGDTGRSGYWVTLRHKRWLLFPGSRLRTDQSQTMWHGPLRQDFPEAVSRSHSSEPRSLPRLPIECAPRSSGPLPDRELPRLDPL